MAVRVFGWSVFTLLVVLLSGGIWQWQNLMERLTPSPPTQLATTQVEDSLGVLGDFSFMLPEEEGFSPLAFKNPGTTWRPGIRWWWPSTDHTSLSLISSLQHIESQGFGHITVQLTQAGIAPDQRASNRVISTGFNSRSLERSWQLICLEAQKRGIEVAWMAPILCSEPKEAIQSLLFGEIHVRGGKRVEIPIPSPEVPPGTLLAAYLEKKDFPEEAGLSWQPMPAKLLSLIAFRVDEHQRSPLTWDLTDYLKLSPDSFLYIDSYVDEAGALSWDAPPGYWDLVAIYQAPQLQHPLFFPKAEQFYLANPLAIDTSRNYSPVPLPPLPTTRYDQAPFPAWTKLSLPSQTWLTEQVYTTGILDKFEATYQYDLLPLLPSLSIPGQDNFLFDILQPSRQPSYVVTDQDERIRYDYKVLRNRLRWDETEAIRRSTVHQMGLGLQGRPFGSTQDLILASKFYDVPTVNSWMSLLGSMAIRQISSGAWLHGKKRVAADAIALPTQTGGLMISQAKEIADQLFLDGINFIEWQGLPLQEDSTSSPSPASWHPFHSPHFNGPQVTSDWSPRSYLGRHAAGFNRYLSRCQYSLSRGAPSVDILVYYPFLGYPLDQAEAKASMVDPQLKQWVQRMGGQGQDPRLRWLKEVQPLLETLQNLGYNWAWVNDDWINSAKVESGMMVHEDSKHSQVLLLNPPHMPFGTMEQLIKLTRSGGQVLVYGQIPRRVPGYFQHAQRDSLLVSLSREIIPASRAEELEDFRNLLIGNLPTQPLGYAGYYSFLRHMRRSLPDGSQLIFLKNVEEKSRLFELLVDDEFKAFYWLNPHNGSISQDTLNARNRLKGYLGPLDSRILWATKEFIPDDSLLSPQNALDHGLMTQERLNEKALEKWHWVTRLEKGTFFSLKDTALFDWSQHPELKFHVGEMLYTASFELTDTLWERSYILDLGQVAGVLDISVNTQPLGRLLYPPYRIDIGDKLMPGVNTLEIWVTPPWRNAWVGKAQQRISNFSPWKDKPLTPAGLLGPVRILELANP